MPAAQEPLQTAKDAHAKVVETLHAAALERDSSRKIRLLRQAQDSLLRPETQAETVETTLDQYLHLQKDPSIAIRRYLAFFLEKLIFFKPSFSLRCVSTVAMLLRDSDTIVRELSIKAACALHARSLYFLALEDEALHFQRNLELLHKVQDQIREILVNGSPDNLGLFRLSTRWAKIVILSQTPSPILQKVRVPPELRGVGCLQDFPEKIAFHLDLNSIRQQAEDLFYLLCNVIHNPPEACQGRWQKPQISALLHCVSAVSRQRPMFMRSMLDVWRKLLLEATAVIEGRSSNGALPVAEEDVAHLHQSLWNELQNMLASNIAVEWRGEIVELLHEIGIKGSLEDLVSQAKCQQIFSALVETAPGENNGEPKAKRPRRDPGRIWGVCGEAVFTEEDAFDGDALLSGEAEFACRRFEDYFGLPSQRELAGHVAGPALLASRIENRSELARLALTSLHSLTEKRNLLRDRAHERAVVFGEKGSRKAKNGSLHDKTESDLNIFLSSAATSDTTPASETLGIVSPVMLKPNTQMPAKKSGENGQFMVLDQISAQLPSDLEAKDSLELLLFNEVLEAQRRMGSSLLRASFSERQVEAFEGLSLQVALHMATGTKISVNPSLQRAMSKAFMAHAFDVLKEALENAPAPAAGSVGLSGPTGVALGKFVDLFFAKFSADVARWQELHGHAEKPAAFAASKTPLRDILEGGQNGQKQRGSSTTFTYAELFELFMSEFEQREVPKRELRTFLNEIPHVPLAAFRILEKQCQQAATRKMALLTILSLLEMKPSCRWHCLHLLFKLAYGAGEDSSVRFDTIRLIINKIYTSSPDPPMRWQLPHLTDEEAAPLLSSKAADSASAEAADSFISLARLKGRCVEDVATLMLRSMAISAEGFAFQMNVSQRIEQLRAHVFKATICGPKDRVWLYLALCIKRPVLLHELVETFTRCDADMKEHLINSIEEAIKHIKPSEPELLTLVQKATPQTERLVLKVLRILMQTTQGKEEGLSKEYGEAVTRFYGVTQNPRLLVPVFGLLERKCLLDFLPAIVQLEKSEVTDAFQQLVQTKSPPLSASELLTELHHLNKPTENIVPIKSSMQALNIMFEMKEKYDPKVYGIVIQSLVEEQGTLPTLFMRTVIQVVKELPRLCDFIVTEILPRLVRQEVWSDDNMWRGFMIVLQHTFASQSGGAARVLSMLPMSQLEDVLVQHPDWKAQLREYVYRQPMGTVPPHVRQLLQ